MSTKNKMIATVRKYGGDCGRRFCESCPTEQVRVCYVDTLKRVGIAAVNFAAPYVADDIEEECEEC